MAVVEELWPYSDEALPLYLELGGCLHTVHLVWLLGLSDHRSKLLHSCGINTVLEWDDLQFEIVNQQMNTAYSVVRI